MRFRCWVPRISSVLLVFVSGPDVSSNEIDPLVKQAMHAEVVGDSQRRSELINRALEEDPDNASARWQAGQIEQDGRWVPIREAETLNAASEQIGEYEKLRDRFAGYVAGEAALARWCKRARLSERERFHWQNVIAVDRNHKEARARLDLREFRGQLMTREEIREWKTAVARYERAQKKWDPELNRLHREIEASPIKSESEAWNRLAEIDDFEATPSLEKLARRASPAIQLHVIEVIGSIEGSLASDALVRLSLDLPDEVVRSKAAEILGARAWYSFVPHYLSALHLPIEYSWNLSTFGDAVRSQLRLRQERPDDIVNVTHNRNLGITMLGSPGRQDTRTYRRLVAQEVRRQESEIYNTMRNVDELNFRGSMANARVYAALKNSTGHQIESQPNLWWDWWKQYNGYEVTSNKEERLVSLSENRYVTVPELPPPPASMECFPAGTPVRTEVGLRPIETLRRGDRVLSQHVGTGELGYKLVLDTTVRKPSPSVHITCDAQKITATLGHPFWVIGKGWTMAKDLSVGDRLHSIDGGITVTETQPADDVKAYNLVVADNNNYFVGTVGVLVHDNELPKATYGPIPGWSGKAESPGDRLVRTAD